MTIRVRHILFFAVSLLCISCSEDVPVASVREYPIEVYLGCDMTKVGIDGNDLFWESGDQVAFRATDASGNSSVAVLTLNDVDSGLGKAKFKGSVEMNAVPEKCEFAYPATAFDVEGKTVFDYSHQDGTHRPYLYGSAAYSDDGMDCMLGHVGGLIRLKVADGVESVSLSSNSGTYSETLSEGMPQYDGQKISKVLLSDEGTLGPAEDASHLIDVAVPSGNGTVYVFMPAMEFTDGFSIVCAKGNEKMFRSFSDKGTASSSYSFLSGNVLDIDLSTFVGFTADCSCTWEHIKDDSQVLQGTKVFLTDFTFTGAPEKIIDQWGVGIYDAEGNFIRWASKEGVFDGNSLEMSDYTGEWPLLLPGDYTLYAACNINGHTLQFPATQKMTVTAPTFTVTVSGKTSWDYRTSPSAANVMDNDAIVEIGAKVNVNSSILANDNYKCKLQFSTNTGKKSEEYDMNDSDYASSCIFDGLAWGPHDLEAAVTFCGVTQKSAAPLTCYITGLPYEADWAKQDYSDWKAIGSGVKDDGSYMLFEAGGFGYAGSSKKGGLISPAFYCPSDIIVYTSLDAVGKNVDLWGSDSVDFLKFYIMAGTRSSAVTTSGTSVSSHYMGALGSESISSSGGYIDCGTTFTLSSSMPCMVYSSESRTHDKALHKIKICYANTNN